MMVMIVNITLLFLLVISAIYIDKQRNLFSMVMLTGIYSLLCASLFICLDAVDVAFTEAAVGVGIATILFLGTLAVIDVEEKPKNNISLFNISLVFVVGGLLFYGVSDLPAFGDPTSPVQLYLNDKYIGESTKEIAIPNFVTAILASYRAYDTLGEITVIFTAGISVFMLIGRESKNLKNTFDKDMH